MMSRTSQSEAAHFIWQHWQEGGAATDLPADLKPRTRAEGYAIQSELDALAGHTRAGWKIAATSESGQQHIAVDGPLAGRIFRQRLLAADQKPSLSGNRMRVVEPEIAFRMGRTLEPRAKPYSADEVMAAVSDLMLSFEVPNSRFDPFTAVGGPTLIADNACAHQLLLSPPVTTDWRKLDLTNILVEAEVAGRYTRSGTTANVLGDPRIAMTWIANELSGIGLPLAEGEFVTTGTCMKPLEVEPGDHVKATYAGLGTMILSIAA